MKADDNVFEPCYDHHPLILNNLSLHSMFFLYVYGWFVFFFCTSVDLWIKLDVKMWY